ncbi:MAG TPA: carbon storage regulator CsrA [Pirellulales bacterium]|jgi:carbon storage regulator
MLVLSRKKGESVVIDGDIKITVLSVQGQTIRLGIEAPRETPVFRSEVLERLRTDTGNADSLPKNRLWPTVRLASASLAPALSHEMGQ